MRLGYYVAKRGTPHIVEARQKIREMLRGESLDNTAHTYQIVAQRMMAFDDAMIRVDDNPDEATWFYDNALYEPFCMEEELFLEEYKPIIQEDK